MFAASVFVDWWEIFAQKAKRACCPLKVTHIQLFHGYSVVPLTMLSLNLDIHRVVKNHKTIHYLSPQGEGKQSSLLSLLVIILLSGNILFKIICQRIIWSHIILNIEWYVSPFTCRWMRAMFVLTFSPLGEKVNTIMVLIHQPVKKSTLGKIVKNCQKRMDRWQIKKRMDKWQNKPRNWSK